jgi:hypothetical protein
MWYHILRFILINRKKKKNPTPISTHLAPQNQNNTRLPLLQTSHHITTLKSALQSQVATHDMFVSPAAAGLL